MFRSFDLAEAWIARHKLTGLLTRYPLDSGAFDQAVESGVFKPRLPEHTSPAFVGGSTSATMEHHHYEDGRRVA